MVAAPGQFCLILGVANVKLCRAGFCFLSQVVRLTRRLSQVLVVEISVSDQDRVLSKE